MWAEATPFARQFFHGTKADLGPGDLLRVGYRSNFTDTKPLSWIYFAATLDAAIWGTELSLGDGRERIYVVEPTGDFEDDPNLTDKRFPGNPTLSYRSRHPLRVVAELVGWRGHSPETIAAMKAGLARLVEGGEAIVID
ncbi:NAD(+)--rifampin ADP-ribosyltransferase [Salinarimonas rosea]|uniref:NAD(+)--rifampin ADP-ribosyltransferase n=1 Tax=Salinarimonas rosea TaxID=552063 RepID=UPI0004082805|nr:NAD(+)--rifampin ADP-ribosyltransferase [Salinarimonas rosea]